MQTVSHQHPRTLDQQSRKIAVIAILLFAFSGLISGFAVGAFVRPNFGAGTISHTGSARTPVSQITKTVSLSNARPVKMGDPVVTTVQYFEKADGTASYTFSAYAVDQSIDRHHGKQIHAPGITCKLWLQHVPGGNFVSLPEDKISKMDIQGPLTGDEIANALNFAPGVSQIQPADANGQVMWNYTVSTSVDPGTYYLVVLMDWQGQSFNWSWRLVTISR